MSTTANYPLYTKDAWYVSASTGAQDSNRLPWKIEWDPGLGSSSYSYEIIRIDTTASSVSGEDPGTYERFYNPTTAQAVLPLRHDLFDGSPTHPITIWTLGPGSSQWVPIPNATGIEGVDTSASFFIRRDIPLSGEEGFTIGKSLFLGNAPVDWSNVAYIRIQILYLGDYVQSKSFRQDLHELANVSHRTLQVDLTSSTDGQYNHITTSRQFRLFRNMDSGWLQGRSPTLQGERGEMVSDYTYLGTARVEDPELRLGIHATTYDDTIDPQSEGQSHVGTWPTNATYFYIDKDDNGLSSKRNVVFSHLQRTRPDLNATPAENSGEVSFQYDADEGMWQAGGEYDLFRREYSDSTSNDYTPYLNKRYPILARFVNGRRTSTNTGWTDNPAGTPPYSLQDAAGKNSFVTTAKGDPSLLEVHPTTDLIVNPDGSIYIAGQTRLTLQSPHDPNNNYVDWGVTYDTGNNQVNITKQEGRSSSPFVRSITHEFNVAPIINASTNRIGIRTQLQSSTSDPVYVLSVFPQASSSGPIYSPNAFRDYIRIGLGDMGNGTAELGGQERPNKNMFIGRRDSDVGLGSLFVNRDREDITSFNLIVASHVGATFRGNVHVMGIFDTYGDIALGRSRSTAGDYNDTFGRPALVKGKWSTDELHLGRSTTGTIDLFGSTLNRRRTTGPTINRLDAQLKRLMGFPATPIPAMDASTYRSFTPYEIQSEVPDARDEVDTGSSITLRTSVTNGGKVDSWRATYFEYKYGTGSSSGDIVETDITTDVIPGYVNSDDQVAGDRVLSGYVRGQLHREGYTARGQFQDITIPVIIDEAGIPGSVVNHAGDPEHLLNSSDTYLDADGRWRYLFDKVYLPVENN